MIGVQLPRRVLMTTDAVGGVWQFSLDLARGLSAAGVAVELVVLGPAPAPGRVAEAEAVPDLTLRIADVPLDWTADAEEAVDEAARWLASQAGDADLVHLSHPAFADAPWPVPVLATVHSCHGSWWATMRGQTPPPPDFRWRAERMRRALALADRAVAPTAALAGLLNELYRPPRPVGVVRNGRALAPRPPAGGGAAEPFVFTAGRLWDEAKNVGVLDAAAEHVAAPVVAAGPVRGPNGEGVEPRNLRLAGELGGADMPEWHAAARVFVSTARYEPFGLAVLEAAQAARPLVLSDIRTFRELWEGAALFAPADDPRAFADRINGLLGDPAEAARWGDRAAKRAGRYSGARMIEGYGREYAALRARQPSRLAG